MIDMLGNPIWTGDTVAYVRGGMGHGKAGAPMLGKVQVLDDPRWGKLYCRVTDTTDESQCIRAGHQVAVCREPPHPHAAVAPPWPGADIP
jgi:hypothetical protein